MEDFGMGLGLSLVLVVSVVIASGLSSQQKGDNIAEACELSGYAIINNKAYIYHNN